MKKIYLLLTLLFLMAGAENVFAQNNAIGLDGTSQFITTNSTTSIGANATRTFEAWVNIDSPSTDDLFVGVNDNLKSLTNMGIGIVGGFITANSYTGLFVRTNSSGYAVEAGKWYHIAAVFSGGNSTIYVNGVQRGSTAPCENEAITEKYDIGRKLATAKAVVYFGGMVDEVRVWDDVRTVDEIRANMYKELSNPSAETNLLLYYNLNETTGTAVDNTEGTTTYDGTASSGSTWITSSAFVGAKNCLNFDGIDDYITIPNDVSLNNSIFSVEFWVKFDDTPANYDGIIDKGRYTNDWAFITNNSTQTVIFHIETFGEVWMSVNDNNWHHIAGTFDGTTLRGYLDGVGTGTGIGGTYSSTTNNINIGKSFEFTRFFNGSVDEVRIWNDVRSEQEIRENMCSTLVGNELGLVAYYNTDNSGGTTLQDFSGNNNNGTFTSTPLWVTSTAFNTWLNTDDVSWTEITNWSRGAEPTSTDNVGIPNYTLGSQPTLASALSCNNLVVGSDATLTHNFAGSHTIHGSAFVIGTSSINSGNFLSITGSLYVLPLSTLDIKAGGQLTVGNKLEVLSLGNCNLLSDATGTGSLIVGGTSSGTVNAKRWVDVNASNNKWHYVSSPLSGQSINTTYMTNNSIYSPNGGTNYNFYRWDEPTDYWIIYGSTGNPVAFGDTEFAAARGYAISRSSSGTLSFSGTIRTADVSYTASYNESTGDGFHVVGNPFTSSIGITTASTSTTNFLNTNSTLIDNNYEALYIWDEQAGYDGTQNDYKVISNASITGYTQIIQNYIQPGQAFMVKVVTPGGNLLFNESMQAHSSAGFYKSEREIWPSVELIVKNEELFNSTSIGFNDYMTEGLDPSFDVGKIKGNPQIALYTHLVQDNGVDFAIQALPSGDMESIVVPVGIDIAEAAICELSINTVSMEDYPVYLEDRQEHTVTNLKQYAYSALLVNSGTGRFYLHFREISGVEDPAPSSILIQIWASRNAINIFNSNSYIGDIKVFNMYGQAIYSTNLNGDKNQKLDFAASAGYYIVNIVTNKGVVNKKVYLR